MNESPYSIRLKMAADPHRPRYHFLSPANWINDPNGLIQWQGQYHLFYQHNPLTADFGLISWGHAVSEDLLHWKDFPIVLKPTPGGPDQDGCWSGCAVDDGGVPTLIYTGRRGDEENVCLVTSHPVTGQDNLSTWQKYARNPIISGPPEGLKTTGFRDPYVWREKGGWYLAIGSGIEGQGGAVFLYRSRDLRQWEYIHPLITSDNPEHGVMWECPNFFSLGGKHVLIVSALSQVRVLYFVGDYRADIFVPEQSGYIDFGASYYAPQCMVDQAGRRLLFGWLQEGRSKEARLEAGWAGVHSLPRLLSLSLDNRLVMEPIPELRDLRCEPFTLGNTLLPRDTEHILPQQGDCLEVEAEFIVEMGLFGLKVCCASDGSEQTVIAYDALAGKMMVDTMHSSLDTRSAHEIQQASLSLHPGESLKLRVFLDRSVVEVFANGCCCLTARIYPTRHDPMGLKLFTTSNAVRLNSITIWPLKPIWPELDDGV